jgi:hypothetical protein
MSSDNYLLTDLDLRDNHIDDFLEVFHLFFVLLFTEVRKDLRFLRMAPYSAALEVCNYSHIPISY